MGKSHSSVVLKYKIVRWMWATTGYYVPRYFTWWARRLCASPAWVRFIVFLPMKPFRFVRDSSERWMLEYFHRGGQR